MQTIIPNETQSQHAPAEAHQERFRPVGATAFFIALILLCLAIWFGIYWLMLSRI